MGASAVKIEVGSRVRWRGEDAIYVRRVSRTLSKIKLFVVDHPFVTVRTEECETT